MFYVSFFLYLSAFVEPDLTTYGILHRGPDSAINLRIVIVADTVFLLFLDAYSKVPDTYVEQTAFGAAGKAIHVLHS